MPKQTITAFYDRREYANNAALMLNQAGVPVGDVTVSPDTLPATGTAPATTGFWASLENMFGGSDDHETYSEGLRRGGILLTAHVDDAKVDDAVQILEQHGSVDMNERESTWRGEGWTGERPVTGGGVASTGAGALRDLTPVPDSTAEVASARSASFAQAAAPAVPLAAVTAPASVAGKDDVLQVAEERLVVGKRAVNRGRVRIHSYVVESQASAEVTLRDETVTVDRRPVDRALTPGELGADTFKDRTIEMDEIDEEAVIAKTTRVVEEIGLRKDVRDEVRTVSDTVRSTKVDIEDGRTASRVSSGLSGTVQPAKDMEVVGSDGRHVGVIDHVEGATLKLKKLDPAAGGQHHAIPTEWVAAVDSRVTLTIAAAEAMRRWTDV